MKRLAIILALFFLVSSIFIGCGKKKASPTVEEQAIRVETVKVKKQDLELKTILTGKLKPIEESEIASKISGRVTKTYVKIGDAVQKGDILFELDSQDMQNAVNQAKAAYNVAEANLKMTQEKVDNARVNLERMRALYEEGAVPKQQVEQFELQASETNIDVARAQLNQAGTAISDAESRLRDAVVTAPISGYITSLDINDGEIVNPGVKVVGIADISKVVVEANLSEYLINKVHKGDKVQVLIKSAKESPFEGNISTLLPAPAKDSLTYPFKVEMKNPDLILKPGMFAEIHIVSDKKENIIAVPSDAVIIKDGNPTVAIADSGKAKLRKVTLGVDNGDLVEITKGLKQGDIVIVKGQEYVDDGSKIKIIK